LKRTISTVQRLNAIGKTQDTQTSARWSWWADQKKYSVIIVLPTL